jgi:hypothetical protein
LNAIMDHKDAAQKALRGLLEKRDTLAAPYVLARLQTLQRALETDREDLGSAWAVEANKAMRQALARVDLDPLAGTLALVWHHDLENPQTIPAPSRWVFAGCDQEH